MQAGLSRAGGYVCFHRDRVWKNRELCTLQGLQGQSMAGIAGDTSAEGHTSLEKVQSPELGMDYGCLSWDLE